MLVLLAQLLIHLGAGDDLRLWLKTQPSLESAWNTCHRGDWMLWATAKVGVDHKVLVRAANACARTALKFTKDPRVSNCLDITDRWCDGQATIEEVKAAREQAWAARKDAVYAAASAAYAAAAAAAYYAAYAAAYYAAYYAAYAAAAREKAQKEHADIVRQLIPLAEFRAAVSTAIPCAYCNDCFRHHVRQKCLFGPETFVPMFT